MRVRVQVSVAMAGQRARGAVSIETSTRSSHTLLLGSMLDLCNVTCMYVFRNDSNENVNVCSRGGTGARAHTHNRPQTHTRQTAGRIREIKLQVVLCCVVIHLRARHFGIASLCVWSRRSTRASCACSNFCSARQL